MPAAISALPMKLLLPGGGLNLFVSSENNCCRKMFSSFISVL
jgi:hypothetical protein